MKAMADARVGRRHVVDETDRLIGVVTLNSLAWRSPKEQETLEAAQKISRRSARTA
jgi:Mg/Co/Ni transporter MgtE